MEAYAGMIESMDYHVGRVIDFLKDIGEYDNTIIVYTSDNGPNPIYAEEYPTNPATFVLNGFMYSLLGLFDLSDMLVKTKLAEDEHEKTFLRVDELLEDGLSSLKAMLPLYDTGSGSTYDLRHYTMAGIEPKVARWDYHATHVNQLYVLSTVMEDAEDRDLLLRVAERWRGYMLGKRAQHN